MPGEGVAEGGLDDSPSELLSLDSFLPSFPSSSFSFSAFSRLRFCAASYSSFTFAIASAVPLSASFAGSAICAAKPGSLRWLSHV